MQNTQDMIQRLNLSGSRLSKSHRRIAEYILQHYDKAVFMTAAKLGEYGKRKRIARWCALPSRWATQATRELAAGPAGAGTPPSDRHAAL